MSTKFKLEGYHPPKERRRKNLGSGFYLLENERITNLKLTLETANGVNEDILINFHG